MKKRKKGRAPHNTPKGRGVVPFEVRLRIVQAVMRGTTHADAAVAFGVSTAVIQKFMALFRAGGALRRWLARLVNGTPLIKRRGGTRRPGPPASEQRVREIVVDLHGLPGAASLARSVQGVSLRRLEGAVDLLLVAELRR